MRIFDSDNGSWEDKVNFVDVNNVFVGYDMGHQCCEDTDWYISENSNPDSDQSGQGDYDNDFLESYVFDRTFQEFPEYHDADDDDSWLYEGGTVSFRLTSPNKPDLYLHLYNCHNGFYGHGFEFKDNNEVIFNGVL